MHKHTSATAPSTRLARRRLLGLLTVGGVVGAGNLLPREWVKPVVDQVVLPAHAQATNPPTAGDDAGP